MRRMGLVFLLGFTALAAVPSTASAQFAVSPFIGAVTSGKAELNGREYEFEKGTTYGFDFMLLESKIGGGASFGFEYAKEYFGGESAPFNPLSGSNLLQLHIDYMLSPATSYVRPYGLVGLNYSFVTNSGYEEMPYGLGLNLGGGAMGFFSEHLGVRGEVRYTQTFGDLTLDPSIVSVKNLKYWRASIGLLAMF